tara:strand:+ start:3590 stop:4465 length:876 start_codon:yes stop_codon:yes gene_type:complete
MEYKSGSNNRRALDHLDLSIPSGEWVALLGPNGSGKSTLLSIASGRTIPTSGDCQVMGRQLVDLQRQLIGVVFQTTALDPRLTVMENLIDLGRLQGIGRHEIHDLVKQALGDGGLLERADDRVSTLSGGLARRVDLVRAMLHGPPLLLLDEPTTGLDPIAREQYMEHLSRIHLRGRTTIIMSTHLVQEAERAGRVIMLNEGKCIADDAPSDLCEMIGRRILKVYQADFDPPEGEGWRRVDNAWTLPVIGHADPVVEDLLEQGVELALMKPTLSDVFSRVSGVGLSKAVTAG